MHEVLFQFQYQQSERQRGWEAVGSRPMGINLLRNSFHFYWRTKIDSSSLLLENVSNQIMHWQQWWNVIPDHCDDDDKSQLLVEFSIRLLSLDCFVPRALRWPTNYDRIYFIIKMSHEMSASYLLHWRSFAAVQRMRMHRYAFEGLLLCVRNENRDISNYTAFDAISMTLVTLLWNKRSKETTAERDKYWIRAHNLLNWADGFRPPLHGRCNGYVSAYRNTTATKCDKIMRRNKRATENVE